MNIHIKNLIIIILCLLVIIILSSCSEFTDPPSFSEIELFVNDNIEDIQNVNVFLINSSFSAIKIEGTDGKIKVDYRNWDAINDESVLKSLNVLFGKGCKSIYKNSSKSTVSYMMWHRIRGSVECGFSYAMSDSRLPEVEYQTEIKEIEAGKWYYYVADYEKWRVK